MRKLVATLACRNESSRLYGKPMQTLDIEKGITVLQYIISWLKTIPEIEGIVLGIAEGLANFNFIEMAKKNNVPYIIGDEKDVLGRLIQCGDRCQATDILRLTTESPFSYFEAIASGWNKHIEGNYDFSCLDNVPTGCGFEIIKLDLLKLAHQKGEDRHRSEFCSLYIRENKEKLKIQYIQADPSLMNRTDLRLAIDYPEDLVLCRAIYTHFKDLAPKIPVPKIISFLDQNPHLKSLVESFVKPGLKSMNL